MGSNSSSTSLLVLQNINVGSTNNSGLSFSMTCDFRSFLAVLKNEIRDFTASLLSEVCYNVAIEPHALSLNDEGFTVNLLTDHNACLEMCGRVF